MKIRLVAEGSTRQERKVLRWGLSFLISDVLFDAFGRADIFWKNIKKFKIDLSRISHVVISHDDWDHIAGLEGFLKERPGAKVWICGKAGKALKDLVKKNSGVLARIAKPQRIVPNIYSLGQMCADTGRGILYEQALVVKSKNGFSVITGCAHPGIVRIARRARKVFGKRIYAVCGGFHMKDNTPEENLKIVTELQALGVKKVVPLHCTGAAACRLFRKAYRKNFMALREGKILEL